VKKYTATEGILRKLGLRELCRLNGHSPQRSDYTQANGEAGYSCENCDADFIPKYPHLDYLVSEENK
jgi:hypothetical protein